LIHLSGFIAAPSFECKEFLHEFNRLDPNIIPVMASFVLLETGNGWSYLKKPLPNLPVSRFSTPRPARAVYSI
jgi:hypothetical protein